MRTHPAGFKTDKVFFKGDITVYQRIEDFLAQLLAQYQFPGVVQLASTDWVTDIAMQLYDFYNPDYMFLSYATPYCSSLLDPRINKHWSSILNKVFESINKFISHTDYIPIIVGSGSTSICYGKIDLSPINGTVTTSGLSPVYAGVYGPSEADLEFLQETDSIQMVIPRHRLESTLEGKCSLFDNLPDYLLVSRRGYAFSHPGNQHCDLVNVNNRDNVIPINSPYKISKIHQVAPLIRKLIKQDKQKVALIVVEGVGCEEFPLDYWPVSNTYSWYTYVTGECQYFVLNSGLSVPYFHHPQLLNYNISSTHKKHHLNRLLGSDSNITSSAVSSRPQLLHICTGADIVIEPTGIEPKSCQYFLTPKLDKKQPLA